MRKLTMTVAIALAAAASSAAGARQMTIAAKVDGNRLVHEQEGVTVTVSALARHVGAERFELYGVADAEIHVFAETGDKGGLRRLWWVQFESYLPTKPELSYNYAEGNRPIAWNGVRTWLRSNPVPTGGPVREGSDREAVFRILKQGGIAIPAEVMNARLVQILDDPAGTGRGRRELMIIYSEDLGPSGKSLAELTADGKPTAAWAPLEEALIKRATQSVTITRKVGVPPESLESNGTSR
jgi:hypothetical protein